MAGVVRRVAGKSTGWVCAAFVLDAISRRVVGWQPSMSSRTDLALDALEVGLWTRQREDRDPQDSAHHSEKGERCPALHPALADAHPSVGTVESRRVVYDAGVQRGVVK